MTNRKYSPLPPDAHRPTRSPARGPGGCGLNGARAIGVLVVGFIAVAAFFALQGESRPPADRALATAVDNRDLAAARAAIAAGAWVNRTDTIGSTLLHTAAWRGDEPMARLLIDAGAHVDQADHRSGETPLHAAARGDQPGMVRLLLAAGADPRRAMSADSEQCNGTVYPAGSTPLSIAEQSGFRLVRDILLNSP